MAKKLTLSELLKTSEANVAVLTQQVEDYKAITKSLEQDYRKARENFDAVQTARTELWHQKEAVDSELAALKKAFAQSEALKGHYSNEARSMRKEVEEAHDLLDCLDPAPARHFVNKSGTELPRSLMQRLASTFIQMARKDK